MNRRSTRNRALASASLCCAAGLWVGLQPGRGEAAAPDPYGDLPLSIAVSGIVRDFRELSEPGGHPDFERTPTRGFAHYAGEIADTLDQAGKPVFASTGYKVTTEWKDAQGRNIMPARPYLGSMPGDRPGTKEPVLGGSLTDADNFSRWYRDTTGVNLSAALSVTLARRPGSNVYTFDDRSDPLYQSRGGFFPINGELYGNSRGETRNFHFTFEIDTRFVYKRGTGQVFTFTGDDDVFVFVDGRLVIDLGGVHAAVSQTIDLDRCTWLRDGQTYPLKFCFAERHRTQSNCRIDTTLVLLPAELPSVTALAD